MIAAKSVEYITAVDKALLRSILYFDIFDYPITAEEAVTFAATSVNGSWQSSLHKLQAENLIFKHGNFYTVQNNPQLTERRLKGNQLAEKRMREAEKYSRVIASFPFVRAVLLSGSISKGFMEEKSDIDYFIITEAKRLWIVRTLLVIFRRVALFNSRRNFCTNYFIDTENLSIPDRNIFTATELVTLKPMYGESTVQQFQTVNTWAFTILPQGEFSNVQLRNSKFRLKKLIEKVFAFKAMDQLNQWLMNKSMAFWKRRYHSVNASDFEIAFRTKEGVSKSHPQFFQKRALQQLEDKIQSFETRHEIDLSL